MQTAPTFEEFTTDCISGRAINASVRLSCKPPLPSNWSDPRMAFDRVCFNSRLEDLDALATSALMEKFRREISPHYKRADISTTKLSRDDLDELCMALLASIGDWRNAMFLESVSDVTVDGSNLAPSGRQLDMTEFSRHLRNEVFRDLQTRYGWGA